MLESISQIKDKVHQSMYEDVTYTRFDVEEVVAKLRKDPKFKNFSDGELYEYAYGLNTLRNTQIHSAQLNSMGFDTGKPKDPFWSQYTYEEILNMANDGVAVPEEFVDWAHTMQDSDTTSYQIEGSSEDENAYDNLAAETDNIESTDIQKRAQAFASKAQAQEELIKNKCEEIKPQVNQVQAEKNELEQNQKASLKQIESMTNEWKSLDTKFKKGEELSNSEQKKYKELGALLNDPNNSLLLQTKKVGNDIEELMNQIENVDMLLNINEKINAEIEDVGTRMASVEGNKKHIVLPSNSGNQVLGISAAFYAASMGNNLAYDTGLAGINLFFNNQEVEQNVSNNTTLANKTQEKVDVAANAAENKDQNIKTTTNNQAENNNANENTEEEQQQVLNQTEQADSVEQTQNAVNSVNNNKNNKQTKTKASTRRTSKKNNTNAGNLPGLNSESGAVTASSNKQSATPEKVTKKDGQKVSQKGRNAKRDGADAKKDGEKAKKDKKSTEKQIKSTINTLKQNEARIKRHTADNLRTNQRVEEMTNELVSMSEAQQGGSGDTEAAAAPQSFQSNAAEGSNSELALKVTEMESAAPEMQKEVTSNNKDITKLKNSSAKNVKNLTKLYTQKTKEAKALEKSQQESVQSNQELQQTVNDVNDAFDKTGKLGKLMMMVPWTHGAGVILFDIGEYGTSVCKFATTVITVATGNFMGALVQVGAAALTYAQGGDKMAPAGAAVQNAALDGLKNSATGGLQNLMSGGVQSLTQGFSETIQNKAGSLVNKAIAKAVDVTFDKATGFIGGFAEQLGLPADIVNSAIAIGSGENVGTVLGNVAKETAINNGTKLLGNATGISPDLLKGAVNVGSTYNQEGFGGRLKEFAKDSAITVGTQAVNNALGVTGESMQQAEALVAGTVNIKNNGLDAFKGKAGTKGKKKAPKAGGPAQGASDGNKALEQSVNQSVSNIEKAQDKETLNVAINQAKTEKANVDNQANEDSTKLNEVQKSEEAAQTEVTQTQETVNTSTQDLNSSKQTLSETKVEVANNEQAVQDAGKEVSNATKDLEKAKADASESNPNDAAIADAKNKLEAAQKQEAKAKEDLQKSQQKQEQDEQTVAEDEKELEQAQQDSKEAQAKAEATKEEVVAAQNTVQSTAAQQQQVQGGIQEGEQKLQQIQEQPQSTEPTEPSAPETAPASNAAPNEDKKETGTEEAIYQNANGQYIVNGYVASKEMYEAAKTMDPEVVNAGFAPGSTCEIYVEGKDEPVNFTVHEGKYIVDGQEVEPKEFMTKFNSSVSKSEDGINESNVRNNIGLINDDYSKYTANTNNDTEEKVVKEQVKEQVSPAVTEKQKNEELPAKENVVANNSSSNNNNDPVAKAAQDVKNMRPGDTVKCGADTYTMDKDGTIRVNGTAGEYSNIDEAAANAEESAKRKIRSDRRNEEEIAAIMSSSGSKVKSSGSNSRRLTAFANKESQQVKNTTVQSSSNSQFNKKKKKRK